MLLLNHGADSQMPRRHLNVLYLLLHFCLNSFAQLNKRLDKACYILYLEPNPHKWGESFVSKNEFSSLWNFFHRVCIVMARRLSVSNLFCLQNHFSYKDVPHLITSFHQIKKTAFNPHMHKMGLQGPKHYVWWPYLLKKARKLRFHVFLHFNPRKNMIPSFYQKWTKFWVTGNSQLEQNSQYLFK